MKTPDPSGESAAYRLQYVSLPSRPSHSHGVRNLIWGVALFGLSGVLFGWALYLGGPAVAYTVLVGLAVAAALYVVARARLLRQRNGNFLAGALVCLLAVALVLIEQGWRRLVGAGPVAPSAPLVLNATPAPAVPVSAALPALIEKFPPAPAELESGQVAVVLRPAKVQFAGATWMLRPGDVLPVNSASEGEVRLGVGTEEIKVAPGSVKLRTVGETVAAAPKAEPREEEAAAHGAPGDLVAAAQHAQQEAARRYPALAVKGSPENESFVAAVQELKFTGGNSFFDDSDWPIRLAEMLAGREGWTDSTGHRKEVPLSPAGEDAQKIEVTPPESSAPAPERGLTEP